MILFLCSLLIASAEPGYYHPSDVSSQSTLFARAQEVAGSTFQARSETAMALAAALRHYEEALDLLGDDATETERQRLKELTTRYHREFAVLQAFTNDQLDGFEAVFVSALGRALTSREATECRPTRRASGPRLSPRFGGGGAAPVECDGADLNTTLAQAMDSDPMLQSELDEILGREWPTLTIDATPQPHYPPSADQWVGIRTFMRRGAPDGLERIEEADDDARLSFQAAIEEGATPENLEVFRAKGIAITAATAARRADLAAEVRIATDKLWRRLAKKQGTVGWCAQPEMLGGCAGREATAALVETTTDNGAVRKALARANAAQP